MFLHRSQRLVVLRLCPGHLELVTRAEDVWTNMNKHPPTTTPTTSTYSYWQPGHCSDIAHSLTINGLAQEQFVR